MVFRDDAYSAASADRTVVIDGSFTAASAEGLILNQAA